MKIGYSRKFSAAHILGNPECDKEWNQGMYGKCCNLHGHTWDVHFEVVGNVDEKSGMIVNFNVLKDIIDGLDHNLINDTVKLPTAENLVGYFVDKLRELELFSSIKVRLYESDHAWAEDEWRST